MVDTQALASRATLALLLLTSALGFAGCGGGGSSGGGAPSTNGAGQIGPLGGAISVSGGSLDGATLNVPPGALGQSVGLTLSLASQPNGPYLAAGPVLALSPAATSFSQPALLTLPYTSSLIPSPQRASSLVVVFQDGSTGALSTLTPISVDSGAGVVSVSVPGGGILFAGFPSAPDAGQSAVTAPGASPFADGVQSARFTFTVRDSNGNPLANRSVTFSSSGSMNSLVQPTGTTDAAGSVTGTLASTLAESKTITATVLASDGWSSLVILQTASIQFIPSPPVVSGFTPAGGAGVGLPVTISGTNFSGATSLSFNGTSQPAFTVVSGTQITTTVPAGSTTGPIQVTTPSGSSSSTNFIVVPTPTISGLNRARHLAGRSSSMEPAWQARQP